MTQRRMLFPGRDDYMNCESDALVAHSRSRMRECLFEIERHEDKLQCAKKRWMYDQARKAGVNVEDPVVVAGLAWTWRKTAIAQDIIGDIQLWKSRLEVYAAVVGGFEGETFGLHYDPAVHGD
jgi:hypothetical protein